jgi:hypothetical protein
LPSRLWLAGRLDQIPSPNFIMAISAPTASEGKKTDVPKAPPPAAVSSSADKDGAGPSMDFPEKWARSIGILGLLPKTKDGKIDPFLSLKLTGNRTDKITFHEWYGSARRNIEMQIWWCSSAVSLSVTCLGR